MSDAPSVRTELFLKRMGNAGKIQVRYKDEEWLNLEKYVERTGKLCYDRWQLSGGIHPDKIFIERGML